jgi:hypothetical protein
MARLLHKRAAYDMRWHSITELECLENPAPLRCRVQFTPTVQHCSMATLIGLCIRVKLLRALPQRFKVPALPGLSILGGRNDGSTTAAPCGQLSAAGVHTSRCQGSTSRVLCSPDQRLRPPFCQQRANALLGTLLYMSPHPTEPVVRPK